MKVQTTTIEVPISTIDYLPTICEVLDIDLPEGVEGNSFLGALTSKKSAALNDRTLFWHYPHYHPTTTPVSAIRKGEWKLIEYLGEVEVELYHLGNDMSEEHNVMEKFPKKTSELLQLLHSWKKQVNAGKVSVNENYRQQ